MFNTANQANEQISYAEFMARPDFSDLTYADGFQVVELFEQVPSIQPNMLVYYIDEDGHMRYGRFINSYKRCRRNAYERKFGKSYQDAKHWQDEDTPYFNEQCEGMVRWVCKRSDGKLDYPNATDVYHRMEIETSYEKIEIKA